MKNLGARSARSALLIYDMTNHDLVCIPINVLLLSRSGGQADGASLLGVHAVAKQGDESQRGPVEGQTHRAFVLSLVKRVIANVWYIASCESVFLSHTVHGRSVSTACLGQPFRERLLNALVGNVSSGSVTCNVQILCNANSMFALFHVGAGCVFDEGARENRALFHSCVRMC